MTDRDWYSWSEWTLTLNISLQPNSRADEFAGLHGQTLKIRVRAPAVDNRANESLVEFLAQAFRCPRANVKLTRGATSRKKTVRIASPARIPEALQLLGLSSPSGGARK